MEMSIGKRLLVFSPRDPKATSLVASTADWGCLVTTCDTVDEFRGRVEGGQFDMVLVEDSASLRRLCAESDPTGEVLRTPLAEIEKRHILRVLSSTGGNKTRAAKILGIDTKTLYNKLKAYGAAAQAARRRAEAAEAARLH
jgi:transcriptional regulator with GAF, ATPase, and Fis domain